MHELYNMIVSMIESGDIQLADFFKTIGAKDLVDPMFVSYGYAYLVMLDNRTFYINPKPTRIDITYYRNFRYAQRTWKIRCVKDLYSFLVGRKFLEPKHKILLQRLVLTYV